MKPSTLFLSGSLLLNAALVAAIALHSAAPVETAAALPPKSTDARPTDSPLTAATWAALQSNDLAAERDRLRAEGFPPAMVRAILLAHVRDRFAAQRRELDAATGRREFWKPYDPDPKVAEARRALAVEEQKILRALLGREADSEYAESLQRQFPGFAPEKIDQLIANRRRFEDERMKTMSAQGQMTPDLQQRLHAIDKAMHAEDAAVLTPAEMEEYDLRLSTVANQVRMSMGNFEPNEAEFRALYRLQSAFEEAYGYTGAPMGPDDLRSRSAAMGKLKADIAAALGPVRAEEFQRASDYEYQRALRLTDRLQLPAQTANDLYALQKEFRERQAATFKTASSREQMTELAKGLEAEANARVEAMFNGDKRAIEAYKANCGSWMRIMQTRTLSRTGAVVVPGK